MEKLLPQSIEAEAGVLGSIILDPEAIAYVCDFLQAGDFYRDSHRKIYESVVHLYQEHTPGDLITICADLESIGKLEDIGGASYITSLINHVPTSGNVEFYGRIVEHTSVLRQLIHVAGLIAQTAYDENPEALSKAEELIYRIRQGRQVSSVSSVTDVLSRYYSRLDEAHKRRQKGVVLGVPTGFTELDRMTCGLQKSDLITLAARPGTGKTAMALNIARSCLLSGYRVLFFSLEMAEAQLAARLLAMETHIDQTRLRSANIDDEHTFLLGGKRYESEWDLLIEALDTFSEAPGKLWIDDSPKHTPLDMRSIARRYQAEEGVDLIIVDYLQRSKAAGRQENRRQEVSSIARDLKSMARDLNIPVLALCQLSRAVEARQDKVPQLSDLSESGDIEAESDIVALLHVDDDQLDAKKHNQDYTVSVIVAKHRNGPMGAFGLRYAPTLTRFHNLERSA